MDDQATQSPENDATDASGPTFRIRRMVGQAATMFSGSMLGVIGSFVTAIIAGRALHAEGYGLWGQALALAASVRVVAGFDTSNAMTRELTKARVEGDRVQLRLVLSAALWLEIAVSLLATVVALALAPYVLRGGRHGAGAEIAYTLAALSLAFSVASSPVLGVLREQQRYKLYGLLTSVPSIAQTAVVIVLAALHQLTVASMAWTYFALFGVMRFVTEAWIMAWAVSARYHVAWWPASLRRVWRARGQLNDFFTYIGATWVFTSMNGLTGYLDVVILGLLRSDAEVGCYRMAKQLASITARVVSALRTTCFRDLSETVALGQMRGMRGRLDRIQLRSILPAGGFWLACYVVAALTVTLLFGEQYRTSALTFALLNLGVAGQMVLFWTSNLCQVLNDVRFLVWLTIIGGVLSLPAMYYFARWSGGNGMAVAYSLYLVGVNLAQSFRVRKLLAAYETPAAMATGEGG